MRWSWCSVSGTASRLARCRQSLPPASCAGGVQHRDSRDPAEGAVGRTVWTGTADDADVLPFYPLRDFQVWRNRVKVPTAAVRAEASRGPAGTLGEEPSIGSVACRLQPP